MTTKTVLLEALAKDERNSRLDVVFGEAYRQITEQNSDVEVLNSLLAGMADALNLPFICLEKRLDDAVLEPLATSGEGRLNDELRRTPERDDDSITGHGPAVRALQGQAPTVMRVSEDGFVPWQKAARLDKVAAVMAVPVRFCFQGHEQNWVVLFAANRVNTLKSKKNQGFLIALGERLAGVCEALCRQRHQQLVCQALTQAGNAAFITDTHGTIVWANEAFSQISGHEVESVIGRNPRFLKSGKQGFRYYDRLWRTISSGKVWSGETVDRDSDGELYNIRQTVSPVRTNGQVTHYISIHEDITDEKAMQAARERARRVDELTGLLTPAVFEERFQRAVDSCNRKDESMALLLLTIHEFDTLMRSLGRDIEELVLKTMGDRIRNCLQDDDYATHLAGGDFAVVLRSVGGSDEAHALGEKIMEVLDEPFPLLGDRLYMSRGLGVAMFPSDATEADELMRVADARAGGQEG